MPKMTQADVTAIVAAHPRLHLYGFGADKSLQSSRDSLPNYWPEAAAMARWLAGLTDKFNKVADPNRHPRTYYLKHVFSDAVGFYIPEGVAILAAVLSGVPMRVVDLSVVVAVPRQVQRRFAIHPTDEEISRRNLRDLIERHRAEDPEWAEQMTRRHLAEKAELQAA